MYVFCIYLRTNSDLCHLQHKLIGFYNRNEKRLQRGTDWVFKYSGLRFVCNGLISPTTKYVYLHVIYVRCFCPMWTKFVIPQQIIHRISPLSNFMEIRPMRAALIKADRRTDRLTIIDAFLEFLICLRILKYTKISLLWDCNLWQFCTENEARRWIRNIGSHAQCHHSSEA